MPDKKELDPEQIFVGVKRIFFPFMITDSYPDHPDKRLGGEHQFFKDNIYFKDQDDNIYFEDNNGQKILLSKIDTANYVHKTHATFILDDLSLLVNNMYQSNKDTVNKTKVYYSGVQIEANKSKYNIATTYPSRGVISFNYANINGLPSNYYEIQSTFRHEHIHVRERKNKYKSGNIITHLNHANVYEEQMKYEEFMKTPFEFQKNVIIGYVIRVVRHFDVKSKTLTSEKNKSKNKNEEIENITSTERIGAKQMEMIKEILKSFNNGIGHKLNISVSFDGFRTISGTINGRSFFDYYNYNENPNN